MAKRIDRLALVLLGGFAFFSFYMGAFHREWLAGALALASVALASCFLRGLKGRVRAARGMSRRQASLRASRTLRRWAMDETNAYREVTDLLGRAYPGENGFETAFIFRHPEGRSMDAENVLAAWRRCRGASKLLILSTCPADKAAALAARELREPTTVLLDREGLTALLIQHPCIDEESAVLDQRKSFHTIRLPKGIIDRKKSPRQGMMAIMMLGMYLLLNRPMYLIMAVVIGFLAGAGWKRPGAPRRLFEEEKPVSR
jgi:hypothetical protein